MQKETENQDNEVVSQCAITGKNEAIARIHGKIKGIAGGMSSGGTLIGFNNPSDLKPVPKDNPAFINIIQKKNKTSEFTNDAAEIIPMLEKLVDCIDDNENLQLFITKANLLTLNIDNLTEKYNGKPESYYESFRKLQEVNRYVKSIAALRREAVTYQRYLAYSSSGSIYNPDNINQQLQYLLEELNSAILLLRSEG